MSDSESAYSKILVPVIIALLAGGSSPWWWCKVFSCSDLNPPHLPSSPPPENPSDKGMIPTSPAPTVLPTKVPQYTGSMGPLEEGVSYNQGDLYDRPASSPEECQALCTNDDRCVAVTFIKSQQRCWVKNKIGPIGKSNDMVSSRKLASPSD